jgi:putative PIN family toxin of toxin-antitoxin system
MRRAVLDPGALVSALIKPIGTPAKLLAQAHGAGFELIVSPLLLLELESVLLRAKFRRYATVEEVANYLAFIKRQGTLVRDPDEPAPVSSPDPRDEYLLALAFAQKAVLVSGDSGLLEIASGAPILAPADFVAVKT